MATPSAPPAGAAPASHARDASAEPAPTPPPSPAPPGAADQNSLPPLDYATPWPRRKYVPSPEANRVFWQGVRKVVFAGGLGLLTYGLACLAAGVERHMAPVAVGWGVAFTVLMLPSPFGPRPLTRRRRRRSRFKSNSGFDPG